MKGKSLVLSLLATALLLFGGYATANDDAAEQIVAKTYQVNVNTANAETLADRLVGVGLRRAEAIVAYREEHGRFYSAEELTAVRGIGRSTVEKNQARILVDD